MTDNSDTVHCRGSGMRPIQPGRIGGTCPECDGWFPVNTYGVIGPHKRTRGERNERRTGTG